jgi:hypothetical protein
MVDIEGNTLKEGDTVYCSCRSGARTYLQKVKIVEIYNSRFCEVKFIESGQIRSKRNRQLLKI